MTIEGQIDSATIRAAIGQARQSARKIGDLQTANARKIKTPETALNQSIKGASNTPSTPAAAEPPHKHVRPQLVVEGQSANVS